MTGRECRSRAESSASGPKTSFLPPLLALLLVAAPAGARGQDNAARAAAPVPVSRYIEKALSENPSLASMRERIRMRENAAIRAGALDDPKLKVGISNVPVDSWSFRREDMTGKEIGISQMLPWPGVRSTRVEAAAREKEETEFTLLEMRNMLRMEIKMAYAELAAVREQIEAVRRSQDILSDIVGVTREMYAVGRVGQADVLRGQVEFGRMRDMRIGLENRERVLSVRLNTLAALPPDEPVPPLEALSEAALPQSREQITAAYEADRPARKATQARIRRGEAMIDLARYAARPDFDLSVSYMQRDPMPDGTSRSDMVTGMAMINVPIWRRTRIEPGIREAEAEKRMAEQDLKNQDLEASNAIGASLSSQSSKASLAALYRTTLIPQAEQSFQANMAAYRVGKVDFPMLMDSVMTILSFRRESVMVTGDLGMEKARLEALAGRELE